MSEFSVIPGNNYQYYAQQPRKPKKDTASRIAKDTAIAAGLGGVIGVGATGLQFLVSPYLKPDGKFAKVFNFISGCFGSEAFNHTSKLKAFGTAALWGALELSVISGIISTMRYFQNKDK